MLFNDTLTPILYIKKKLDEPNIIFYYYTFGLLLNSAGSHYYKIQHIMDGNK